MRQGRIKSGFTIMELLVVIFIIGLLGLGASQIRIQDNTSDAEYDTSLQRIKNLLEEVRNNSLTGKAMRDNRGPSSTTNGKIIHPDNWRIEIRTDENQTIQSRWTSGSDIMDYRSWNSLADRIEFINHDASSLTFRDEFGSVIEGIQCVTAHVNQANRVVQQSNDSNDKAESDPLILTLDGGNFNIEQGCSFSDGNNYKIVRLNFRGKEIVSNTHSLIINTITGTISIEQFGLTQ